MHSSVHGQETHDDINKIVPPLFMRVVIDIDANLFWQVLVDDFTFMVLDRLHIDHLASFGILDKD